MPDEALWGSSLFVWLLLTLFYLLYFLFTTYLCMFGIPAPPQIGQDCPGEGGFCRQG